MDFQPFVYGLVDPLDTNHVRYVGLAGVRASRPYDHVKQARQKDVRNTYLVNWIRKLQGEGRDYAVIILEELAAGTSPSFVGFVEKCYIKSLREIGHRLTNITEGGAGILGSQISDARKRYFKEHPEARMEISRRNLGNKYGLGHHHTDEVKQQISIKQKGVPRKKGIVHSETSRVSRSEKLRQYNGDPANQASIAEYRARQRVTLLAANFHHSEEAKQQMSATRKGRTHTEAAKAKMSAALRAAWARRKSI